MRNIKLVVEYDGTSYCGWQRQKNGISVQEVLERCLKNILRHNITLIGAGRTDSGVHAKGQVANFKTKSDLPAGKILSALNSTLPNSIKISAIEDAGRKFNARFDAKTKLYRYTILNRDASSPFEWRYSYLYRSPLNIKIMKNEAKVLLGRHDFSSFQALDIIARPSIVTIKKIKVTKAKKYINIDIEAKGFVYNMVRNIAGTLIEFGRGRFKPGGMRRILAAKNRKLAGPTASAKGLCLLKVNY
ncbi:MAG: tRNA pseudouridine(38-40) synthase TruA [Candidatus Omnitrophica bacterium CG07_land_8_20_14_0_80_42_15]|uniref:tRNA pseudouridine synthase A n=1 Tax=Candidatus Aquitaenariimonas noxiae TaxID=1974741 RepID=A0A2J0L3P2_9BACT|nr:MAG: tRNA pseudouridine(38-40) synthase TruA [Candidatus Omnitrophica bacterium CG07_land_8_20_14_0_80_42_15]